MIKRKLHKMMNILNYFVYSSKQQLKKKQERRKKKRSERRKGERRMEGDRGVTRSYRESGGFR